MKILFSLSYYHPYVSGLTICVQRLAQALAHRGHAVSVLSMQYDRSLPSREIINDVLVHRARIRARVSKGFLSFQWIVLSWKLARTTDVVVVNLPQFEGVVPAVCAWVQRKRLVVVYHCDVVLPPSFSRFFVQGVLDLSHEITLTLAAMIVCYTEDYAQHSRLLPKYVEKCRYIYPPIDEPNIDTRVQKNMKKNMSGKTESVIGVAARLSAEKGIEYLLDALILVRKKHPVRLLIAGPMDPVGEEAYKKKIMKFVKRQKDHVVFLGKIAPEEMGSFYSVLDVLVLPSVNATEAFGMVQVEAMLAGVPVIASDLPGVRVPVRVTGMGLCVPIQESVALAQAILDVIQKKQSYRKDPAVIAQIFSRTRTIDAYEALLQN